ncbi:FkbM family methyltransferase [Granulicella sp. dw_53]|uniref:FkbM family methyltransferase n=1 Tax=Granulicella sp. dw_53 TaxID=2719792 RepID=UPI001BD5CDE3|nr:FkbM family methyltransferase [Granulicella sp. dw_53]
MPIDVNRVVANPFGRTAYLLARPFVTLLRRTANPGIPTTRRVAKVRCGDRRLSIRYRRWSEADALAIQQCFVQRQYDMPTGVHGANIDRLYQDIVASGRQPLIVDCGANIGTSVAWFSARYPESHIVAIEPSPDNVVILRENAVGLDVDIREAGIGPHDGHAFLKPCGSDMGYRTTDREEGIAIQMLSLATILAGKPSSRYTPFLLKVDIEGAEESLFSGDLTACSQFPLIILEPHDWMFPGKLSSLPFFKFHAEARREFCMNHENVASIALLTHLNSIRT